MRPLKWIEVALIRALNARRIPMRTIAHAFGRSLRTIARYAKGARRTYGFERDLRYVNAWEAARGAA